MEEIAVRAKLARTTIYFHYENRTELLADLLKDDWDRREDQYRKLLENPKVDRPTLKRWLRALVEGVKEIQESFAIHAFTISQDPKFIRQLFDQRERMAAILGERLPVFMARDSAHFEPRAWVRSHLMVNQLETFSLLAARDLPEVGPQALEVMLDELSQFIGLGAPRQSAAQ
jgi:AcrR family transcriptional regulator